MRAPVYSFKSFSSREESLPAEIGRGSAEASRNGKWGPGPARGTLRSVQAHVEVTPHQCFALPGVQGNRAGRWLAARAREPVDDAALPFWFRSVEAHAEYLSGR